MTENTGPFTVTSSGGDSKGRHAHMTLHVDGCPAIRRTTKQYRLTGWMTTDGRVIDFTHQHRNDPHALGNISAHQDGVEQVYGEDEAANVAFARLHLDRAAESTHAYRVCGRCKPAEHPTLAPA